MHYLPVLTTGNIQLTSGNIPSHPLRCRLHFLLRQAAVGTGAPGDPTASFVPVPAEEMSPRNTGGLGQAKGVAFTIKAGAGQGRGRGVGAGGDWEGRTVRGSSEDRLRPGRVPAPSPTSSLPRGHADQVTPGAPACPTVESGQKGIATR